MSRDGGVFRSNIGRVAVLAAASLLAGLFVTAPIVVSTATPAAAFTPAV